MRFKSVIAALVAVCMIGLALPQKAFAFGERYTADSKHDPYHYNYEPRGYYPYYDSHYWRPAHKVRNRRSHYTKPHHQPPYFKAWGLRRYKHVQERYHHGRRYRKHHY